MFPSLCAVLSVPFHSFNVLLCLLWLPFSWPCHILVGCFFLPCLSTPYSVPFSASFSSPHLKASWRSRSLFWVCKITLSLFWKKLQPIDNLPVGPAGVSLSLWMYKPQTTKLWGASCAQGEIVGKTLLSLTFNPGKEMEGSFWAGHWKKKWERNVSSSASILDICWVWEEIAVIELRLCT